jgi:predicted DNA-binding transcriptional regulator
MSKFGNDKERFKRAFMPWLRGLMIRCWDTGVRQFDEDLIKAKHLIRCELSKNNLGYKTFIGYTYKDISPVPPICNEDNGIYPTLVKMAITKLRRPDSLIEEFIVYHDIQLRKDRSKRKIRALSKFIKRKPETLRDCIKVILSDEFKKAGDGTSRGMFILVNDLKRVLGLEQAEIIIHDWNARMGNPIRDNDIRYRLRLKNYTLTCDYIHSFLKGIGIDVSGKCKGGD